MLLGGGGGAERVETEDWTTRWKRARANRRMC